MLPLRSPLENIERVHCSELSTEAFYRRFEIPEIPCIIDGLATSIAHLWEPKRFLHHFATIKLKVGDNDDGKPHRVKMRHFRRYLQGEAKVDDSPLYVFDSHFGERAPDMLRNYHIPPYHSLTCSPLPP